jgi:hypothetical protein
MGGKRIGQPGRGLSSRAMAGRSVSPRFKGMGGRGHAIAGRPGGWQGHRWYNTRWGHGYYGRGWYGHRGGWGTRGWGLGWWPWFTPGLFWPSWGYYSWRPYWGWGWWPEYYYDSPYIIVNNQQVLDQPWWYIKNETPGTLTATNADDSDEVDIESGTRGKLMYYGNKDKGFTLTFPDGYQTSIETSKQQVTIYQDAEGNIRVQ